MLLGDAVRQSGTQSPVRVANLTIDRNRDPSFDGWFGLVDKLVIQSLVELVFLRSHLVSWSARTHLESRLEHGRQIQVGGLGGSQGLVNLEQV